MPDTIFTVKNAIISFFYRFFLKKIFFRFDPEDVHDHMTSVGKTLGKYLFLRSIVSVLFSYKDKSLEQKYFDIDFINPIGLSAGFDKNAELLDIIPKVGFSFEEIGSITSLPCLGNPKPRLWRLPRSKALVVYYGLKNNGVEEIGRRIKRWQDRLKNKNEKIPIFGVSIAMTNCKENIEIENAINDFKKGVEKVVDFDIGNYITINVSCPNTQGGQPFINTSNMNELFAKISPTLQKSNSSSYRKPVFIKISPDIKEENVGEIINICDKYNIDGVILSNLTKKKDNPEIKDILPPVGGVSGKPVYSLSLDLISQFYKKSLNMKKERISQGWDFIIIGCGGIFNAKDAYEMIKNGASLIQMITGMIYEGPQIIGKINNGLVKLLKKDGFKNIREAIGQNHKS